MRVVGAGAWAVAVVVAEAVDEAMAEAVAEAALHLDAHYIAQMQLVCCTWRSCLTDP